MVIPIIQSTPVLCDTIRIFECFDGPAGDMFYALAYVTQLHNAGISALRVTTSDAFDGACEGKYRFGM